MIFEDQFLQLSTTVPTTYVYGFGESEHENFKHDFNWRTEGMWTNDEGVKVTSCVVIAIYLMYYVHEMQYIC